MEQALAPKREIEVSPQQIRVKAALSKLGIELEDKCWVWPEPLAFPGRRKINWATFLAPLSEYLRANPTLPDSFRWLTACWLTGCGGEFKPMAPNSVHNRTRVVRRFLCALLAKHECLEVVTPRQAQATIRQLYFDAHGQYRATGRALTLVVGAARDLYRFRAYLPGGFMVDPFPDSYAREVLARGKQTVGWVAPPEPVCLDLIRQAVRFLGCPAEDLIRLRGKYIQTLEAAKKAGGTRSAVKNIALKALSGERFGTVPGEDAPWTSLSAEHPLSVKRLITALEGACATVLLFLSGPRASEVYRARRGCLRYIYHSNGIQYPYYFAARSKQTGNRPDLRNRGWILGPAGVRALEVLDRLSRPVRLVGRIDNYWATVNAGSGLWTFSNPTPVTPTIPSTLNNRLNVFAATIQLAERTGWEGRLHSHMGRKACARFIAKRDRTALADLALQFGHLSAYVTDASYARPDAEYRRLLDEELASEMREVAVELAGLDVKNTYSNVGDAEVASLRDRVAHFVGELYSTADVRRLLGLGVRLVPCDWGMCVYREETSACGGNQFGPSSERRSPAVCRKCVNFFATEKHRPYWQRRIQDCERVLALRDIPDQARRLVTMRMEEAKEVISCISRRVTTG